MALQMIQITQVSDASVREIVRKSIQKRKAQGKHKIDAIEVYFETHLPIIQITRALEALKRQGVLSV